MVPWTKVAPKTQTPDPDDARAAVEALLAAYERGLFPMADPFSGRVRWYDPDPRGVFELTEGGLRVTRSLRQRVRSARFRITADAAFGEVIRACAPARPGQEPWACWIDGQVVWAYEALHHAGHAHSIEAWLDDQLVGGLYGVHHKGLFAGESMFSRPDLGGTDASKVCLVHLWHHLRAIGVTVLDTQFYTDHLGSLGCIEIPRADYRRRLAEAMQHDITWHPFDPERARLAY